MLVRDVETLDKRRTQQPGLLGLVDDVTVMYFLVFFLRSSKGNE